MDSTMIPDISPLIERLLGTPYKARFCWDLTRQLIDEGFGIALEHDPSAANAHLCEVWRNDDTRDPLQLVQMWDCLVFYETPALPISTHVGLAIDYERFVHARTADTGVAIEKLRRWRPRLLQIVRLRRLLLPSQEG